MALDTAWRPRAPARAHRISAERGDGVRTSTNNWLVVECLWKDSHEPSHFSVLKVLI